MTVLQNEYKITGEPSYTARYCMNAGPFGYPCDKCVRLCPEKLFPEPKTKRVKFDACTKCGICAAACPSAAITPVNSRVREFMMAVAKEDEISVGCEVDEDTWTIQLDCLAALSWEQIAIAALKTGIALSVRKCAECEREECRRQVFETIERARRFLGDDVFFSQVQIIEEGDEYVPQGKGISRRELLTFFMHMPLDTALNMLPKLGTGEQNALIYRAILRDMIQEKYASLPKEKRPRYIMDLPRVNDKCYMCGNCKRQCPEKALDFKPSDDGETFMVTVEAWKCTACGVCEKICREKAITGMSPMAIPHIGKVMVKRVKMIKCALCGKPIKAGTEDGLCDICRIKEKSRIRREEAEREKAEKAAKEAAEKAAQEEKEKEESSE